MRKRPQQLWACSPATRALALERLAESGLTEDDAAQLGVEALDAPATARLSANFEARPSLMIPYFGVDAQPMRAFEAWPDFFRVRYLGPSPPSFADQTKAKPRRYAQPPETGVCCYFPASLDWAPVARDPRMPVVITEGELKAACASATGTATLGVGGVWSWRSAELGVPLLPELAAFEWRRRRVYLAFDSDFRSNRNVCMALWNLAEELARRGAIPEMLTVPELGDGAGKTGLDDFIVESGADAFKQAIAEAQPLTLARVLWGLNGEAVYVRDPGLVVVRETAQRISAADFGGVAFAARPYSLRVLTEDGGYALKPVRATAAWLNWPVRAEVARLVYKPGAERDGEGADGTFYNMWGGWGCAPRKGSVAPWRELLKHLFSGPGGDEARTWLERWCAYPLQHPGVKMTTYVMVWGDQGVGKSTVAYALKRIYGKNFSEVKQSEIHEGFNGWAENKQLVLVDDVSGTTKRQEADTIKKMVSQKTLRVNVKYLPSYEVDDVINYYFTSNHSDALLLEDGDRRCFVWQVLAANLPMEWYGMFARWLDEEGGAEALFHHLLNLDLGDFDPYAPALKTGARMRMILDGKSDLGMWVAALRGDPGGILRLGEAEIPGELFTAAELRDIYDPEKRALVTAGGMVRELTRAAFWTVLEDFKWRDGRGRLEKFYAVRNPGHWTKTTPERVEAHLAKRYGRIALPQYPGPKRRKT